MSTFERSIPLLSKLLEDYKNHAVYALELCNNLQQNNNTSTWFLENILQHQDSKLYYCNTFTNDIRSYLSNKISQPADFVTNEYKSKVIICRGHTHKLLKETLLKNRLFNLIYIHKDTFASNMLEYAVLSFRLLHDNGILIFSDYYFTGDMHAQQYKSAINSFINTYKGQIEIINLDNICIIRKKAINELTLFEQANIYYNLIMENDQPLKSVELENEIINNRIELANILLNINYFDHAIEQCDIILNKNIYSWRAFYIKALCFYKKNDIITATNILKLAINNNIHNVNIYNLLINILYSTNKDDPNVIQEINFYSNKLKEHTMDLTS
jgi:hypothetical protein